MDDIYKRQQEKVQKAQNDFQDLISQTINEAFNAGRKAEIRWFKLGKTISYKETLFNLQAKYVIKLSEAANSVLHESNMLRGFEKKPGFFSQKKENINDGED